MVKMYFESPVFQYRKTQIYIFLLTDPAEVTNFTVTPVKLSENDTLTVSCNFVGNPLPKYYLYRDTPNAWVLQSGLAKSSTISLTRSWAAKCVDTGTWCCQAQNDLNTPYSMRIQDIKVLCKQSETQESSTLHCTNTETSVKVLIRHKSNLCNLCIMLYTGKRSLLC